MSDRPVHLVLGATGGIGSALTRRLVDAGAVVVAASRGKDRLDELAGDLDIETHAVDATDADAVEALVTDVADRHGGLDGAACCVGSLLLKPAHRTSVEEWREAIALNLDSAFFLVRAAAGAMQRRGGGSIALVSTVAARLGMPHHEAIAAAKGGVTGLALAAAASYANRAVRVNAVAPGLIATPLTERLHADPTARKVSEAMHPLGRIGEPDDVASALAWLLDPAQAFVTGQVLGVDGGMGSVQPRQRA